jgi:hypothetical protein
MTLLLWAGLALADPAAPPAAEATAQEEPAEPPRPRSAYSLAMEPFQDRELEEVLPELREAALANPDDPTAQWHYGWARYLTNDFEGAAGLWDRVATLQPDLQGLAFWRSAAQERARRAPGPMPSPDVASKPVGEAVITIAAAGDAMLGSDLRRGKRGVPDGDGTDLLADVQAPFLAADLAFVNVESAMADGLPSTKCGPKSTSCYAFRTPTRYTAALVSAGIDVVSHANNHAMDLGEAGMLSTAAALDAAAIAHAGRLGDQAQLTVGERTVAVVAAHTGECCLSVHAYTEVAAAVQEADAEADLVIFSFHGGAEGSRARHVPGRPERAFGEERGDVRRLAKVAVDAGADLVLGHGPHVLRAMEVYRGRLIAYSLGNFVGFRQFGTKGGVTGTSVILEAALADNGALVSARLHPVKLDGQPVPRVDPDGAAWTQIEELSREDLGEAGVTVQADGTLSWKGRPPSP